MAEPSQGLSFSGVLAAIVAGFAGGVVTMLGWLVNYWLQERAKQSEDRRVFVKKQYEEFYGPLLSLIQRHQYIDEVLKQKERKLKDRAEDLKLTKLFYVDTLLVPIESQIRDILATKGYLAIDPMNPPKSFDDFLKFEAQSTSQYILWSKQHIEGASVETIPWPPDFEKDISQGLQIVREEYKSYLNSKPKRKVGFTTRRKQR